MTEQDKSRSWMDLMKRVEIFHNNEKIDILGESLNIENLYADQDDREVKIHYLLFTSKCTLIFCSISRNYVFL